MKNLNKLLILLLAVSFVFASCNRRTNRPDKPDTGTLKFTSAEAEFRGDPFRVGADFYDLYLLDQHLTQDPDGDGTFIYLQMTTDMTDVNEIIPGTYKMNKSNDIVTYTFEMGSWQTDAQGKYLAGSFAAKYEGAYVYRYPITDGELRITQNNNRYTVNGIIKADGYIYNVQFGGDINFYDMVAPLPETLTHGELWYWGNVQGHNAKIYSIRLADDAVRISDFAGAGDALQIEVYAPITAGTILPDGTYPVKIDRVQTFTAIDGFYDEVDNADYGTWYYTDDALSINKGWMKSEYIDGSSYRIEFNFTDDYYGYNFGGVYQGELPFLNKTSSPIAVREAQRAPQAATARSAAKRAAPARKVVKEDAGRVELNRERKSSNVKQLQQVRKSRK